jgi:hypothetical protein
MIKSFLLALAFVGSSAFATNGGVTAGTLVPIPPNAIKSASKATLVKKINEVVTTSGNTTGDGNYNLQIAKASFSFADGDLAVGAHGLGVSLPAKAVIIRSWLHITTQFVDSGTCTYAISCEDANNIKTATDISGTAADGLIEGESTGAASAFKKSIAATCEITGTMADGGSCVPSAGAGQVFVEYVVQN